MRRFAAFMRQKHRFMASLNLEQRDMKRKAHYDIYRTLLPLRARARFERAVLLSMLMDTAIQHKALVKQITKLVDAKIACKRARIQFHLRFFNTLDGHQRVNYGFLMMKKWKYKKMLHKRAMHKYRRFKRMVHRKYWRIKKRWGHHGHKHPHRHAHPHKHPHGYAPTKVAPKAKKSAPKAHKHFFAAPKKAAPAKVAPKKAAPVKVVPKAAPKKVAPKKVAPAKVVPTQR